MASIPLVVGISGGSASGKTTLAHQLSQALDAFDPVMINQDQYFRDWQDVPGSQREAARTSNHPRAVLWDALVDHVAALRAGQGITAPVAGTRAMARGDRPSALGPGGIIFVEGHLVFGHAALRDLMDVKIFLDVDAHERVLRRMVRDTTRGRMNLDGAVAWYRRDVIPNFPTHTEATRVFADLIVPFEGEPDAGVTAVANGLRGLLLA